MRISLRFLSTALSVIMLLSMFSFTLPVKFGDWELRLKSARPRTGNEPTQTFVFKEGERPVTLSYQKSDILVLREIPSYQGVVDDKRELVVVAVNSGQIVHRLALKTDADNLVDLPMNDIWEKNPAGGNYESYRLMELINGEAGKPIVTFKINP
jgi:hypothetical protein